MRTAARWVWDWRWVLVLNGYLLSPVFAYELRLDSGGIDKTLLFILSASVFWLLTVQLVARRIWITHAVLFPFYLVVLGDLFVISNYQTRMASTMIITIIENFGDARDFLESEFKRVASYLTLMLAGYGYALWRIRNLRVTLPRAAALAPLTGAAAVYLVVHRYLGWWPTVLLADRNSPFGVISQVYLAHSLYEQEAAARDRAKSFHFGATRPVAPDEPELYVLVIGESSRKHDWSLFGYARETNPRLAQVTNLVEFTDVLTQVAQTQVSVPLIITRGAIDQPEKNAGEKSVVSIFDEVGFYTFWFSTQQRETAMAAISRFTGEADVTRFFERRYDAVLVDAVKDALAKNGDRHKKLFFVLHTLGSHFNLTSRYPRQFAKFPDGQAGVLSGTSASMTHAELIGAYDNTILYTDYVLSELVNAIHERPGIKAMLYIPDHGDNLRDDSRNLFGHAHSNEYDVPIPMLFWYSDEYARRYPDKIAQVDKNASRPINTRAVFYSLIDMADIHLNDPDLPHLSVFSPELQNVKRMVYWEPKPFDFDEKMAQTGTKIPVVVPPE